MVVGCETIYRLQSRVKWGQGSFSSDRRPCMPMVVIFRFDIYYLNNQICKYKWIDDARECRNLLTEFNLNFALDKVRNEFQPLPAHCQYFLGYETRSIRVAVGKITLAGKKLFKENRHQLITRGSKSEMRFCDAIFFFLFLFGAIHDYKDKVSLFYFILFYDN